MDDTPCHFIPPVPTFPRSSPSPSFIPTVNLLRRFTACDVSEPGPPSEETNLQALHMPFHPVHPPQHPTLRSQDVLLAQYILASGIPHPSGTNFSPPDDPSSGRVGFSGEWEPRGYPVLGEVHLAGGDPITRQSAVGPEYRVRLGAPVDQRMYSDIPVRVVEGPHPSVFIDPQSDLQTCCVEQNSYTDTSRFTLPYNPIFESSQNPSMARKPAELPPTPVSPPTDASPSRQTLASTGVIRASQNRRRKKANFQCVCGQTFTTKNGLRNHDNSHRNIRPYKCQKCTKCFVTKHDCKRHGKRCNQTRS